jgi:uncharacterized membrane protein
MNRVRGVYLIILIGALLWCGLIIAAPLLLHAGGGALFWADALYEGFHRVCHQLDNRSLHLYGEPFPVCMRCSAVYFAFLAGTLLYPLIHSVREPRSPSRLVLILAVIPMLLDVVLGIAGISDVTAYSRLLTGTFFGFLIPFVVLPVALGAVHERSLQPTTAVHQQKGSADA